LRPDQGQFSTSEFLVREKRFVASLSNRRNRKSGATWRRERPTMSGDETGRPSLDHFLDRDFKHVTPLEPEPITLLDATLDESQREAVAAASQTPDICVIASSANERQDRLVVEIIRQTVANGERLLLVASSSARVNTILEHLTARDDVLAVRCGDENESK